MKKYIIVAITLLALNSCNNSDSSKIKANAFWKVENSDGIGISNIMLYKIDSCEYIGKINGVHTNYLSHKGNCKYCVQRNTK